MSTYERSNRYVSGQTFVPCAVVGMPFRRCGCSSVSDTHNALRRAMYSGTSISTKPPYLGGFYALVGMPLRLFSAVVGVLALATPTTHYVEQCIWVFLSPQPPYLGGWGVGFL